MAISKSDKSYREMTESANTYRPIRQICPLIVPECPFLPFKAVQASKWAFVGLERQEGAEKRNNTYAIHIISRHWG